MKKVALYIHIPFCKSKCLYCDFPSFSSKENLINDYINALIKEINSKADKYIISSLFIGGGTPSYLDEENLEKLLKVLDSLKYIENAEKTMECNPGTVNLEKLKIMKKYNINRLSFGLQSSDNKMLKSIGRIHKFEDFKQNFLLARELGFSNINVDMMFGLPNQTVESYLECLRHIVKLSPEHISAYSLILEEGTCFYKRYEDGILDLPSEDEERDMYHKGKKLLESFGYMQYEISNFAKHKYECVHNIAYWKCYEYLGLGAFSSSYIDNKRLKNICSIEKYIQYINDNKEVSEVENINSEKDNMEEFMFMGLRMIEGINKKDFFKRFKKDIYDVYKEEIQVNVNKNLLNDTVERIKLTPLGIEFSNEVMSDFCFLKE